MKVYAISDTHGITKKLELPACDLLLHAGDICADSYMRVWTRHFPELTVDWMREVWLPWMQPMLDDGWVKQVVMTWGNHDWTQNLPAGSFNFLPPQVRIGVDELIEVDGVKIWCSPWSNEFNGWSWMKESILLEERYARIPKDVDIILSHQPPLGYGGSGPGLIDHRTGELLNLGSAELVEAINRVRPKHVVCGHIHAGAGKYRMPNGTQVWNVSVVNEQYKLVREAVELPMLEGG